MKKLSFIPVLLFVLTVLSMPKHEAIANIEVKIIYDLSMGMKDFRDYGFESIPINVVQLLDQKEYKVGAFKLRRFLGRSDEDWQINSEAWFFYARAHLELNDFEVALRSANRVFLPFKGTQYEQEIDAIIAYAYLFGREDFQRARIYTNRILELCETSRNCELYNVVNRRVIEYEAFVNVTKEKN